MFRKFLLQVFDRFGIGIDTKKVYTLNPQKVFGQDTHAGPDFQYVFHTGRQLSDDL